MSNERQQACMVRLTALLASESAALEEQDTETAMALYSEKKLLIDEIGGFGAVCSKAESEIARALLNATLRNQTALQRAIAVQRTLFGIVSRAAASREAIGGYGSDGSVLGKGKPHGARLLRAVG